MQWGKDAGTTRKGLTPGQTYEAVVVGAEDFLSREKQNPGIKLTLKVTGDGGHPVTTYDYIMSSYVPKIKEFCDATGLQQCFDACDLQPKHCMHKPLKFIASEKNEKGYCSVKTYVPIPEIDPPF